MKKFIQFIGNYFNHEASHGEQRSGEAILRFDLDKDVLHVIIDGWACKKYKLEEVEND